MTQAREGASPEARLRRIVEDGLCIGCRLCQSVAGRDEVTVEKAADGELRPRAHSSLDHAAVDRIPATCPGVRVEGLPTALAAEAPMSDPVWGLLHRVVLGWAADNAILIRTRAGMELPDAAVREGAPVLGGRSMSPISTPPSRVRSPRSASPTPVTRACGKRDASPLGPSG